MAEVPNNPRGKASILAIDDDPGTRQLLADVLALEGYEVRTAESGESGLALVAAHPPDLILLDIRMPGMDRPEFCRRIKRDPLKRHIPIMILGEDLKEQLTGFRAGAVDFVLKPFARKVLLARIQTHLDLSRVRLQIEQQLEERTRQLNQANERLRKALNDHWKAEAAWKESEARFRNLANAAPLMICAFGPDRLATFFNTAWLEFRGRPMEQEAGRGWADGLHPDDREPCLSAYALAFDARRDYRLEYRLRRADGEYRRVLWTGVPLYQPAGIFVGYISSCVDITESRRNQEERQAAQKTESLGVLAAGIVHDFNNLLGVIYAEADLALSRLDSGLSARDHIQNINSVATRAAGIVDLLRTYAASGNAPAVEAVDLSAAVEEMLRLMRTQLADRQVSVISHLSVTLPPVRANGQQVRRIIMNLLTNAAEVLENGGGSITVRTAFVQVLPGQSVASLNLPEGNYVRLAVSDTGPGMSEETLARAMDPFFTTKSVGHGMGLAVVKGIVRSHGGAIRVASGTGKGSTFEVLLPCAAEPVAETAIVPAPDIPSPKPTVLLVEDQQTLRTAVERFLRQRGMMVVPASGGREALAKLLDPAQKIDLVFLDLTLPDMSGFDVLAEMRKIKPDVRIVLTSAYDLDARSPGIIEGARRATFIRKPYRLNELLLILGKEIESAASTGTLPAVRRAAH